MEFLYPYQGLSSVATSTREVYLTLDRELPAGFSAAVGLHQDIKEIRGFYGEATLGQAAQLPGSLQGRILFTAGYSSAGWARRDSGGMRGGPHQWTLLGGLSRPVRSGATVEVSVGYTNSLDVRTLPEQEVHFWGGAALTVPF